MSSSYQASFGPQITAHKSPIGNDPPACSVLSLNSSLSRVSVPPVVPFGIPSVDGSPKSKAPKRRKPRSAGGRRPEPGAASGDRDRRQGGRGPRAGGLCPPAARQLRGAGRRHRGRPLEPGAQVAGQRQALPAAALCRLPTGVRPREAGIHSSGVGATNDQGAGRGQRSEVSKQSFAIRNFVFQLIYHFATLPSHEGTGT